MQTKEEKLSYENLYELYVNQQMTTRELASHLGMDRKTISKRMKEYGIDKNTQLNYFQLNDLQYDLMIGSLLGDGGLKYEGGNYRIRFSQAEKQKEYCQFKLDTLIDFCKTKKLAVSDGNKKASVKAQLMYYFNTRALPCFNQFGEMTIIETIKNLNTNSFAIWMMDDGYLANKGNSYHYTLSVKRFNEEEMNALEEVLSTKLNLKYNITNYENNNYRQVAIYFPVSETEKIANLIINSDFGDKLQETMLYKIYKKGD